MDDRVGVEPDYGQEAVKWFTRHAIKCKPGSRDVKDREDSEAGKCRRWRVKNGAGSKNIAV